MIVRARAFLCFGLICAALCAHGAGRAAAQGSASAAPSASQNAAPTEGAASSAQTGTAQSMLYPGEDFQLQPGDLIAVRVFMQPDYQATVRLSLDGNVQLPFLGSVHLQGKSVGQAQTLISELLKAGQYYQNPDVTIQVLDTVNGSVIVTGEVHAIVPVSTERSLRDVLLTAGGLPANASHTIKIVRAGVAAPIVVNLGTDLASSAAANIPVKPHDFIQITRANVVYVLGAFARQGAVPLDQAAPLTLLQLAALSGGIGFEGRYDDLRLIRTEDTDHGPERKVIEVDIKKVRDGKVPDPVLQANDIVFLPTNEMKAVLKGLGSGGVLGIVSILVAAHGY